MKNLVLCATLNILFFIDTVYSSVQITPVKSIALPSSTKPFSIECNITYDNAPPNIIWKKNDEEVTSIKTLKGRVKSEWKNNQETISLTVESSVADDVGNYSCVALDDAKKEIARGDIIVGRFFAIKVQSNLNVVEEERLRLECQVYGNPTLSWQFQNTTYNESAGRVTLQDYTDNDNNVIKNGLFIIEKVDKSDAGPITCIGQELDTIVSSSCTLRVKDKYAALWPFLGICVEVVILCAIIVIYEKKRNKTELEESDTDQSPDQKNTPDQGKDSNLRHRQ